MKYSLEEIRLKYQATGDIVEEEMDFLFSEIDLLLAEVERLRGHIKTFPARLNEARRMGRVDANKSWEEGHIYGKEQERLRKEDNAVFTEEIMKLEEQLQSAQAENERLKEQVFFKCTSPIGLCPYVEDTKVVIEKLQTENERLSALAATHLADQELLIARERKKTV